MNDLEQVYRSAVEELWNQGDLAAIDRYFHPEYTGHGSLFPRRGRIELRETVLRFREAIAGMHYDVHEVVVQADIVAARWTVTGRHVGLLFGIPGTGRRIEIDGMSMNRIADGKIIEGWIFNDTLALLGQLGQPVTP